MKIKNNFIYYVVPLILLIGLPAIPSFMLKKSPVTKPPQISPNAADGGYYDYTQNLDQVSVVTVDEFAKTFGVPLNSNYQNHASSTPSEAGTSKSLATDSTKVSSPSSITVTPANTSKEKEGPIIERMANGSMKATLPASYFPAMKAKIKKDGLVQVYCNDPADDFTK